ncbi:ImmA/IrrE family metallo-endopeptidase [Leptothoe sp. PORK10 BA2]|uniref:ImmA/IrrE family metallo-endopeptidase n=1 Tax=Leptothoe sp. PORK10 BA2 TaxID=3110254 RepID=UPI002B211EAD|nr:ImmA/IrrE family metallo-endopeptidase [Leptothoe sp. PORK10 BA2]MEA5463179.1 ImmA/IrrE family metallo-endopeptidase [Leptothoe sp. PORK10 BA2]
MTKPVAGIQPKVLAWARQQSGYSINDIARKLKREPTEVAAWETGEAAPTYVQLEKLAYKFYKRPLALFFMPAPPEEPPLKQEFRTLPMAEIDTLLPQTRYLLRTAQAFQLSLRELNDGTNSVEQPIFKAIKFRENVKQTAQKIQNSLGIGLTDRAEWRSADDALKAWRHALEQSGVYVFKQSFEQKAISGFCLVDDEFPIIFINNSTAKTRQIFTLFHELAHVLMGVNTIGKIDDNYADDLPQEDKKIEQLCNALAAEILVPLDDFAMQIDGVQEFDDSVLEGWTNRYWVSREVILRRLLDADKIARDEYVSKTIRWQAGAQQPENKRPGGSYYATQVAYLGENYLRLVFDRYYQGRLDVDQVAGHLGIKAKNVSGIEAQLTGKGIAA